MTMTIRRCLYASAGTLMVMGCAAIVVLAIASDLRAQAQPSIPKDPVQLPNHRYDLPVTVLTAAQIDAHKQRMLAAKDDDVPMNMVKAGGSSEKHQVGISLVMRAKGQSNPNFAVHDDVAEVYHVLEGKGTMLVGGRIVDWQRRPTSAGNGMGSGGTKADGARQIQIAKGDVVIIPAGTPHRWLMADEFTLYTVVRLDPDGVTPLEDYKEGAAR
jgi:mannose-6-phosphate isomerase-like protein (cupin superfamily)